MKFLITGANGFVGRALWSAVQARGIASRAAVRVPPYGECFRDYVPVGNIDDLTDWSAALSGCDVVIHLAARAHVIRELSSAPLDEYRRVNVAGTRRLGQQAASMGVRRIVFLSSIKVNGEQTAPGAPFLPEDVPKPEGPYGLSKMEAENELRRIGRETGMEVVIVRAPLVYGPGVKANFAAMVKWIDQGLPLPLGAVTENRRSMVALDNLVDLLIACAQQPHAANRTWLVSDGEDISTAELLTRCARAMGKRIVLFPVPPRVLQAGARLAGRQEMAQRLLGSLQVDISKTRHELGWNPPISIDEGLCRTVSSH